MQYNCLICHKILFYLSSLKKHLQVMHSDTVSSDPKDHKWEAYYQVIKAKKESRTAQQFKEKPVKINLKSTKPKKLKKQDRILHNETHVQSTKAHTESPIQSSIKEFPKIHGDDSKIILKENLFESYSKSGSDLPNESHSKGLEKRVKNLPVVPKKCEKFKHAHDEYYEYPTIIHFNHIDYFYNKESNFVTRSGTVYPHKLEASSTNPLRYEYQKAEEPVHNDFLNNGEFENFSLVGLEEGNVLC